MTNGEKLKEIFPSIGLYEKAHDGIQINFNSVWFNAEYQEPTTKKDLGVDAVNREAVLDLIADYDLSMGQVVRGIHALPSVTPQESKTGHWIVHPKGIYAHLVCNKCLSCAPYDCETNYCPHCGAKMAESEE